LPCLSGSAPAATAPGPAVRRTRLPSVHSAPDSALRCARNRLGPVPRSSRLRSEAAQQAAEQPAEADHRLSELLGPDTARPVPAGGVAGPPVAADLPRVVAGEVVPPPPPARVAPLGRHLGAPPPRGSA